MDMESLYIVASKKSLSMNNNFNEITNASKTSFIIQLNDNINYSSALVNQINKSENIDKLLTNPEKTLHDFVVCNYCKQDIE